MAGARTDITETVSRLDITTGVGVDAIMPAVYDEIRRIAQVNLKHERPDHTLSATALANEAYLRLVDQTKVDWKNKQHFMAVAAQAIRRILVDHARSKRRQKRGSGSPNLVLNTSILIENHESVDLLNLEETLMKFEKIEPEKARVVELRFYGEMTEKDIAEVLSVSERTVRRYWQYARAWMYREMFGDERI